MRRSRLIVSTFGLAAFALVSAMSLSLSGCADSAEAQVVEAACGECQFGMEGNDCDLAVRIDGTPYFVDGFGIDDLGDAHAEDGLCNAIRQARITGQVENGRFKATAMELLPAGEHDEQDHDHAEDDEHGH